MARWSAMRTNFTPVLVADATAFTTNGFLALQAGAATQRLNVWEIKMGGLATASAPMATVFARDVVLGTATLSGGTLAALDPSTAALSSPPVQFSSTTGTYPQRSATLQLLDL